MWRAIVVLTAFLVLATAGPAAAEQEVCKTFVFAKQKKWAYQGSKVKCDFQHDAVKAFLRDDVQPEGFKCTRVKTSGVCKERKGGDRVFIFYVKRPGLPG